MTDIPTQAPSELKPCPFCGVTNAHVYEPPWGAFAVICEGCGAESASEDSNADAIAAWNRRTQAPTDSAVEPAGVSEARRALQAEWHLTTNGVTYAKWLEQLFIAARQQPAEMRGELRNIAEAKRFDRELFDDDTSFADWAQSRARHTLAHHASPSQPSRGKWETQDEYLATALRDMKDAYERRIRSLSTPDQLAEQPWRCMEFVTAEQALAKNASRQKILSEPDGSISVGHVETDCAQGGSPADPERPPALREAAKADNA